MATGMLAPGPEADKQALVDAIKRIVSHLTNDSLTIAGGLTVVSQIAWFSDTNFSITLDHTATANRLVVFQDLAGTVALLGAANGGHLIFVDNTYDIGASGATRPRNLYLAGNGVVGGTLAVTGTISHNGEATAKTTLYESAGADYTLTTSFANLTPATAWLSLTPGNWLVIGAFRFIHSGVADTLNAITYQGKIATTGGTATIRNSTSYAIMTPVVTAQDQLVTQAWSVEVTATTTLSLQAMKTAGTGASVAKATHTTLTAVYVGNA